MMMLFISWVCERSFKNIDDSDEFSNEHLSLFMVTTTAKWAKNLHFFFVRGVYNMKNRFDNDDV